MTCPKCAKGEEFYRCDRCREVYQYTNKYSDCGQAGCEGVRQTMVPCPTCYGSKRAAERAIAYGDEELGRQLYPEKEQGK